MHNDSKKVAIDRFRIVPAPLTGIGWVAVQEWNGDAGEYWHIATYRSMNEAEGCLRDKPIRLQH